MKPLATLTCQPGETAWRAGMDFAVASRIAHHFYHVTLLERTDTPGGWGVKTIGGYVAIVGEMQHPTLGWLPAILHKTTPLRTIVFLEL